MNKVCQSCGMPLVRDPAGGGTNIDGSLNTTYCSYCYRQGLFIRPDMTAKEMQNFCSRKLQESGVPNYVSWFLVRNIPKLQRWKQHGFHIMR